MNVKQYWMKEVTTDGSLIQSYESIGINEVDHK